MFYAFHNCYKGGNPCYFSRFFLISRSYIELVSPAFAVFQYRNFLRPNALKLYYFTQKKIVNLIVYVRNEKLLFLMFTYQIIQREKYTKGKCKNMHFYALGNL